MSEPFRSPLLIGVGGLVASGKSSVARALAESLGVSRIEADRVRDSLLREAPGSGVHESQWARHFEPEFESEVYRELLRRAEIDIASRRSVVLDACFPRSTQREAARGLAGRFGARFVFVECRVDETTHRKRLVEREAHPGERGWMEIHRDLAERWETTKGLSPDEHWIADTTRPLEETIRWIAERLGRLGLHGV